MKKDNKDNDNNELPTIKEILKMSRMNMLEFSEYFGVPYRTVQDWKNGIRPCKDYLIELIIYKLENEGILSKKETGKKEK